MGLPEISRRRSPLLQVLAEILFRRERLRGVVPIHTVIAVTIDYLAVSPQLALEVGGCFVVVCFADWFLK